MKVPSPVQRRPEIARSPPAADLPVEPGGGYAARPGGRRPSFRSRPATVASVRTAGILPALSFRTRPLLACRRTKSRQDAGGPEERPDARSATSGRLRSIFRAHGRRLRRRPRHLLLRRRLGLLGVRHLQLRLQRRRGPSLCTACASLSALSICAVPSACVPRRSRSSVLSTCAVGVRGLELLRPARPGPACCWARWSIMSRTARLCWIGESWISSLSVICCW